MQYMPYRSQKLYNSTTNIPIGYITCALCRKDRLCAVHGFSISRKGGTGGGGWGHLQGVVAARLGCERAMVGTGWATSHPDYMDRLRNTLLSPCRVL